MSADSMTTKAAYLDLYKIMNEDSRFDAKADAALELGRNFLDVENAHLTRVDEELEEWLAIKSTDQPDGEFPPGLALHLDSTYCRRVVEERESIVLHDAPEQGWADDPAFETHDLSAYHGSPIIVDESVYGTLCFVQRDARDEPFSDSETLFAELAARLLEHELQREQFAAETQRRANSVTVLSRVLRHNLRNELTVVRGHASWLSEQDDSDTDVTAEILESVDRMIAMSDKARKLETIVSSEFDREAIELESVLDRVVSEVTIQHPDASVAVDGDVEQRVQVMPTFELALLELVENAVKHSGTDDEDDVVVSVSNGDGTIELAVTDHGPGMPEQERTVLSEGMETALIHGSGLGLWMVYWIVTTHDGTIDIDVTDDGTTVTLIIPRFKQRPNEYHARDVQTLDGGHDRFEAVFEESFEAMVLVDDDRRIVDANERAADLFDTSQQSLLGRGIDEFAADSFDVEAAWGALQDAGRDEGQFHRYRDDGSERTVEYSASANVVPGQHLIIGRDVTDRS